MSRAPSILSFTIKNFFFFCQFFIIGQFPPNSLLDLLIRIVFIITNIEQVISLVVSKQDTHTFKAKELGQLIFAVHDKIRITPLSADHTRCFDRGHNFSLSAFLSHIRHDLLELGLNKR